MHYVLQKLYLAKCFLYSSLLKQVYGIYMESSKHRLDILRFRREVLSSIIDPIDSVGTSLTT